MNKIDKIKDILVNFNDSYGSILNDYDFNEYEINNICNNIRVIIESKYIEDKKISLFRLLEDIADTYDLGVSSETLEDLSEKIINNF